MLVDLETCYTFQMQPKAKIFTDGSSRGNPGPGGWATIISFDDRVVELGGYEKLTTNNRMELFSVIRGLEYIRHYKKYNLKILFFYLVFSRT